MYQSNRNFNIPLRVRLDFRCSLVSGLRYILVPRGRAPFSQHQESRPLASSNNGSPRFTDFPLLCACSESSLTNLIGSGFNLLCLQIHSKPGCRWTWPEVAILGAGQKERGLWVRQWSTFLPEKRGGVRALFANSGARLVIEPTSGGPSGVYLRAYPVHLMPISCPGGTEFDELSLPGDGAFDHHCTHTLSFYTLC